MNLLTKHGNIKIDVTPWAERMKENVRLKRDPFEQTPVAVTAKKEYFWWDEAGNPELDKRSVTKLLNFLNQ